MDGVSLVDKCVLAACCVLFVIFMFTAKSGELSVFIWFWIAVYVYFGVKMFHMIYKLEKEKRHDQSR